MTQMLYLQNNIRFLHFCNDLRVYKDLWDTHAVRLETNEVGPVQVHVTPQNPRWYIIGESIGNCSVDSHMLFILIKIQM